MYQVQYAMWSGNGAMICVPGTVCNVVRQGRHAVTRQVPGVTTRNGEHPILNPEHRVINPRPDTLAPRP